MKQTRRLLVEGKQDLKVLDHVCYAHGVVIGDKIPVEKCAFELKPHEGFDSLRAELKVALKGSALTHIGVVVDADELSPETGLSGRWSSIRQVFLDFGYACPKLPEPGGTILRQEECPTVGFWVMPDNLSEGKLETFISALVPSESPLWAWANESMGKVPLCEERFVEKDRVKALVHTYLAVQKQPGTPMGSAVRNHYFDANVELALRFMTWIQNVFELPVS
jgi:hypothetical protein